MSFLGKLFHFLAIYDIIDVLLEHKAMTAYDRLKELFMDHGVLSLSDECCSTFPRAYFSRLVREGFIFRIGAGVYSCLKHDGAELLDYAEACKIVPRGVVCLFSALKIHGVTLENPHRIQMALPRGCWRPQMNLPVDYHIFSLSSHSYGIKTLPTPEGPVRVYSVEKTIADCFKFRNVVGLDVAIAALKDAKEKRLINANDLWTALKICRVSQVIRPYMDGVYA